MSDATIWLGMPSKNTSPKKTRPETVEKTDIAQALAKCTHGIYVLTTSHSGSINGMIASWVTQVYVHRQAIAFWED